MKQYIFNILILFSLVLCSCTKKDCNQIYEEKYSGYNLSTGAKCYWVEHDGCGAWIVFIPKEFQNQISHYTNDGYDLYLNNTYGSWYSKHVSWPTHFPYGMSSSQEEISMTVGEDCYGNNVYLK